MGSVDVEVGLGDAGRLGGQSLEVSGVVVPDQAPRAGRCLAELCDRRVERLQLEPARAGDAQQMSERRVDDAAMARYDDRAPGVGPHRARNGGTDAKVELGGRLAARKHVVVRIPGPVRVAESLDERGERHPVDLRARVVLSEVGIDDHLEVAERRRDRLGGLDRPLEVAGDQDVGRELARRGETVAESFGLPTTEIRQPAAGAESTDHAVDGHIRLAVPDEGEGRQRCLFGVRHPHDGTRPAGGRLARPATYAPRMISVRVLSALVVAGGLAACTSTAEVAVTSDPAPPVASTELAAGPPPTEATPARDATTIAPGETALPVAPADRAAAMCARPGVETWGVVENDRLTEASGLVASRHQPDVLWSHNDGGTTPGIFAIGADGIDLGFHRLDGVDAVDIEDIALVSTDDGDDILLADIGDNARVRDSITVFRFSEPDPAVVGEVTDVERLEFVYPDGPHNAEVLLVDDVAERVVIVTKEQARATDGTADDFGDTLGSLVFEGSFDGHGAGPVELVPAGLIDTPRLERLAMASGLHPATLLGFGGVPTGGDVSADGALIALRTYETVWLWPREPGQSVAEALAGEPCEVTAAPEAQGEAIAFVNGGLVTLGEGVNQPLYRLAG